MGPIPRIHAPVWGWAGLAAFAVVGLALVGRGGVAPPSPAPPEGAWVDLPPAPVMTPGEHHGVWTGTELVVVGGRSEFVSYDPALEAWRDLPPPPVDFGHDPLLTWTGEEVLVWGGELVYGRQTEVAAYTDGRWRQGVDLHGRLGKRIVHVWAGDRLLVWDRTRGVAYDPAADEWTDIPRIHVGWEAAAALWTGAEVLVWGTRLAAGAPAPFGASYDPLAGTWEQRRRPWMLHPEQAGAVWTGAEALLWGRPRLIDGADGPPAGFAYRPGTGAWRLLPDAPVQTRGLSGVSATMADGRAIFYGGNPPRGALAFDGAWHVLPPGGGARTNPVLAWTGTELLVWGGFTPRGPTTDLAAWRASR